ncbi:hypothetical protein EVAR_52321_1 [Eumeta japonica]|uniref:(+)RNA virus helicase C-terminal domain-containing protein n=1 Tax=Eumeta variegata TaxID=151549 RepID=A0A4C1Y636_EUMVA|nr:hypothetical protein EVAR_52321_1 [Eumeta japonica]
MVAYSVTNGLVALDENEKTEETEVTRRPKYTTPSYNPIVVTTRSNPGKDWVVPDITWANAVPGCVKTRWVVKHFEIERDFVNTITLIAANDLREKLASRLGADASKVKTKASVLVNGFRGPKSCHRLIVDEALMSHFGAIVMATRLAGAKEVLVIGDVNQLTFIDRLNLFEMVYVRPNLVATVTRELLCTYRVTYALNERFGKLEGSRILTIHEAQGLASDGTDVCLVIVLVSWCHEVEPRSVTKIKML